MKFNKNIETPGSASALFQEDVWLSTGAMIAGIAVIALAVLFKGYYAKNGEEIGKSLELPPGPPPIVEPENPTDEPEKPGEDGKYKPTKGTCEFKGGSELRYVLTDIENKSKYEEFLLTYYNYKRTNTNIEEICFTNQQQNPELYKKIDIRNKYYYKGRDFGKVKCVLEDNTLYFVAPDNKSTHITGYEVNLTENEWEDYMNNREKGIGRTDITPRGPYTHQAGLFENFYSLKKISGNAVTVSNSGIFDKDYFSAHYKLTFKRYNYGEIEWSREAKKAFSSVREPCYIH